MASAVRSAAGFFRKKIAQSYLPQSLRSRNALWKERICFHTSSILDVAGQLVKMPSLSPTMTEGTIVKWMKQEGDTVSAGDVLCEIQTDKAVMALETEEEGILAKILVPNDTKDVKVGTAIALMVSDGEDWKSVEMPAGSDVIDPGPIPTPAAAPAAFSGGSVPGQPVKMPSLSPTMTEGTILKWLKKEGDRVAPGDVLCEIQTDKAVMSFEIEEEGILAKILVGDDSKDVKVGSLIALMVNEGEDWKDVALPASATVPAAVKDPSSPVVPAPHPQTYSPHITPYGPAVKTLLEQYQLEAKQITPSGRKGRLLKEDVLQYINKNNLSPKQPHPVPPPATFKAKQPAVAAVPDSLLPPPKPRSGYTDIEVSSMRRTIAKRLTESKMLIPHAYCTVECEMDSITALRGQLKRAGIAVSVNDFVIKAVAHSLTQCPDVNVLYLNNQTVRAAAVDISVAVATPAGLITPIVTNADHKQLDAVSAEVRDLAGRAKLGKLQLHEFQGGSFTISNLGMFGIHEFSAIINPPQCGILAVAGSRPVFRADERVVSLMTSTLSYDARAIDEVSAAEFLEAFRLAMESPACLLLGVSGSSRAAVNSNWK